MIAISHAATATASWGLLVHYTGMSWSTTTFLAVTVGSLLPDIDTYKSWVGRRLWFISAPIQMVFGHRGITHSLIAVMAMAALIYWWGHLGNHLVLALAFGYLAHLTGDLIANSGVPLLWPWDRRFSIPLISTGKVSEYLFVAVFLVAALSIQKTTLLDQTQKLKNELNQGFSAEMSDHHTPLHMRRAPYNEGIQRRFPYA